MIRDLIQSNIGMAFNLYLSDAVYDFTCSKKIKGSYNPVTETWGTETDLTYSGRGVLFGSYNNDLVKPENYLASDAKAVILLNEVTGTIEIGDKWDTPKGKFKVISKKPDPAMASISVQLRAADG